MTSHDGPPHGGPRPEGVRDSRGIEEIVEDQEWARNRVAGLARDPDPQWVIVKATFAPTGQTEPVARFGDPMVLPDVQAMLIELGWLDPTAAETQRAERDILRAVVERCCDAIEQAVFPDRIMLDEADAWVVLLRKTAVQLRGSLAAAVDALPTPTAARVEACTGVAARWCPVHGQCVCPYDEYGDLDDPGCPLHAQTSTHAEAGNG